MARLVGDTIDAAERARATDHIETCDECCALVARLARSSAEGRAPPRQHATLTPGTLVAERYSIVHLVGVGGMGEVYAAHDARLDRPIALKVLLERLQDLSPRALDRFVRESKVMARVRHPHVVAVYDADTWRGRPWVAMELVEGETMATWASHRPWSDVVRVWHEVALGLAQAHRAGVVHRDIKPANVLVDRDGRGRLTDFGLAKPTDATGDRLDDSIAEDADPQLTSPGARLGTPAYMAPEQFEGGEADERSDVFALCASLYEGLFGHRPFGGRRPEELQRARLAGRIEPVGKRSVPRWVRAIVWRGLRSDPRLRWPSAQALADAIERGRRRKRHTAIAAVAVGASLLGATLGIFGMDAPGRAACPDAQQKLEGWWTAEQRQAIAAAGDVGAQLERWIAGWQQAHAHACGDEGSGTRDLQLACLDDALARARVVASRASDPEIDREKLFAAIDALPAVESCAAPSAWVTVAPVPSDPLQRAQVETLRRELARADALRTTGAWAQAEAALGEFEAAIDATGHAPLAAERDHLRATIILESGRLAEARDLALAASHHAEAARHDHLAVRADTLLIAVCAELGEHDRALEYADRAEAALARLGGTWPELESDVHSQRGTALHRKGQYAEAEVAFERALERAEPASRNAIEALSGIASARMQRGHIDEGRELLARVHDMLVAAHGENHPNVMAVLVDWAGSYLNQGRTAEARPLLERAIAIADTILGPDHPRRGQILAMQGAVAQMTGDQTAALAYAQQARAVLERAYGPRHVRVAMALEGEAMALAALGRNDEGIARMQQAYDLVREVLGEEHTRVANSGTNLVTLLQRAGRAREAVPIARRSAALLERQGGPLHPQTGVALSKLGAVLRLTGEIAEARRVLERAVTALSADQADRRYLAVAKFELARVVARQGDRPAATALAEQAAALIAEADPGDVGGLGAEIREFLAPATPSAEESRP